MSNNGKYYIIDFDSTFTREEALDVLGEITLNNHPEKSMKLQEIKDITDRGMNGSLDFRSSLEERLKILEPTKNDINDLVVRLKDLVSQSFKRNKEFLTAQRDKIYIISNGFKDFICPIVEEYGIKPDHVFANAFVYDGDTIIDFDRDNILSSNNGKVKTIEKLGLGSEVYVIGDGYTDYEIKKAGLAKKFYAFTENVERENVKAEADHIAPSLDEILFEHNMNTALSYPKNRIKVLILENIHENAYKHFIEEGYQVETIAGALDEEELREKIKGVHILGIRSKTNVTSYVLENANRLLVIGAFCIGTNQIDLTECQKKGISVFNAPYSNTRSVVELAISEIILLMRNLPDKISAMHEGKWNKSATNAFEIRGKKLGILGYGNIGSQLSVLAEAMGLDVYYYDLTEKLAIGNATKCSSMEELFSKADVISLHVDGRQENSNLITRREIAMMKDGAILINLGRGFVVNIPDLADALNSGKLAGAGIDVFPEEPKTNHDEFISELKGLENVILTPHIGGSTKEAQINIADYVPYVIKEFINSGSTDQSVNFPEIKLPVLENAHRLIHIHENVSGVLANIDKVLADHKINIVGQYLKTNDLIGYVITDIEKEYPKDVIDDLKKIPNTIRVRTLY